MSQEYREIVTKAVCGKGRKYSKEKHSVSPSHRATSILGCWVINHLYHAKMKSDDTVEVKGSYDINIWYSYNDNTKTEVVTERVSYSDHVPLAKRDKNVLNDDYEVIANVKKQPNCLECEIAKDGNRIDVEIEREFNVKAIGETMVFVTVDSEAHNDHDDDDWYDEITDDELSDVEA